MAVSSQTVMNPPLNDPVTKAVVDNIMGNLPTKKPLVRCDDCDLCFTSQTVLDAHLQGARHAKQIRSKVILATLEETKVAFTKDQEANELKCNICNVCLNSIQQLQTHLNGNRHKKKIMKGGSPEKEEPESKSFAPSPAKAVAPKAVETKATPLSTKGVLLTCDSCNKFFNSQAQYDVHMTSKKHILKMSGAVEKNKKKRFFPYRKKTKSDYGNSEVASLSRNFISGGYVNNA